MEPATEPRNIPADIWVSIFAQFPADDILEFWFSLRLICRHTHAMVRDPLLKLHFLQTLTTRCPHFEFLNTRQGDSEFKCLLQMKTVQKSFLHHAMPKVRKALDEMDLDALRKYISLGFNINTLVAQEVFINRILGSNEYGVPLLHHCLYKRWRPAIAYLLTFPELQLPCPELRDIENPYSNHFNAYDNRLRHLHSPLALALADGKHSDDIGVMVFRKFFYSPHSFLTVQRRPAMKIKISGLEYIQRSMDQICHSASQYDCLCNLMERNLQILEASNDADQSLCQETIVDTMEDFNQLLEAVVRYYENEKVVLRSLPVSHLLSKLRQQYESLYRPTLD